MDRYEKIQTRLEERTFITDGGLETTLVFEKGFELPQFAAFPLMKTAAGREILRNYYLPYIDLARENHLGFVLEAPTWRASQAWGEKLGFDQQELSDINRQSIKLLSELRSSFEDEKTPMLISGCIGPRGDGYHVDGKMSVEQAWRYHAVQVQTLSSTEADLVSAFTLNYVEEAIGITYAAQERDIPLAISFTVETDGRLPSGQPLGSAIEEVDATTAYGPLYYMINCAHPSHFEETLLTAGPWRQRIRALRANASCKSHGELDEATELNAGDPIALSHDYMKFAQLLPNLTIFGGCCGTDVRHVQEICHRLAEHSTRQPSVFREAEDSNAYNY